MDAGLPSTADAASRMGRLYTGRLTKAWKGEAADLTPLLKDRLDQFGEAIGGDLASIGEAEVSTAGGRRIDIVARDADGAELVIENQYGTADFDHLTRGLAYAVASNAPGLIVVAEEHRDEFRAVAQYLSDLADADPARGIRVWLVEARAIRVDTVPGHPCFGQLSSRTRLSPRLSNPRRRGQRHADRPRNSRTSSRTPDVPDAASTMIDRGSERGHRFWLGTNSRSAGIALVARGPAVDGLRSVIAIYPDGHIMVPFHSYAGSNTWNPIEQLATN